jgi:hypothetical protein
LQLGLILFFVVPITKDVCMWVLVTKAAIVNTAGIDVDRVYTNLYFQPIHSIVLVLSAPQSIIFSMKSLELLYDMVKLA